jgi:hypothetical protein
MKVKKMGITEILRRIWLLSANKIKSSELNVELNSSLRLKLGTQEKIDKSLSWRQIQDYENARPGVAA